MAPAEPFAGDVALLVTGGGARTARAAEQMLRAHWQLDSICRLDVGRLQRNGALDEARGAFSWLEASLRREIARRNPSLIAIAVEDASGPDAGGTALGRKPAEAPGDACREVPGTSH